MEKLIIPDIIYKKQIKSYRREFILQGSSLDGCGALKRLKEPEEWLKELY